MGFLGARQRSEDGRHGRRAAGPAPEPGTGTVHGDEKAVPEPQPPPVGPRRLSEFEELERRALDTRGAAAGGRSGENRESRPDEGDRWQPIVVDRPAYDFEPKPPVPAPLYHVPDTVFEGWSSAAFTMRLASTRGASHRFRAQPRQDHAEVFFREAHGSEAVVFAVADGVSNAEHGELGSMFAAQGSIHTLLRQLTAGGPLDWAAVLADAAAHMAAGSEVALEVSNPAAGELAKLMATTLVVGVVGEVAGGFRVVMARVGDSGAWVLSGKTYRAVFAPKRGAHADLMPSAVEALPRIPAQIPTVSFELRPDEVLLVGTDGFGDPLGDGTGAVGELFARWLDRVPPPRGFAHLLDFSRDTFDDDRTLLAVWPRPRRTGAGR